MSTAQLPVMFMGIEWPNQALEPTRVGAFSSAAAVHASQPRVAQLGR